MLLQTNSPGLALLLCYIASYYAIITSVKQRSAENTAIFTDAELIIKLGGNLSKAVHTKWVEYYSNLISSNHIYDKFAGHYDGDSGQIQCFRLFPPACTCSLWLFHLLPVSLYIRGDKLTYFMVVQCALNLSLRVSCTKFIFWQQTDSGSSLISELLAPSS